MRHLYEDFRLALRSFVRAPRFALVAVATLALGIGATTAVFAVVNAVLLRPLPYHDSEKLLHVEESHPDYGPGGLTYATYLDLRAASRTVSSWSAYRWWTFTLVDDHEPENVKGALISAEWPEIAGIHPVLGRFFAPGEDQPGGPSVVVIGYGLWQRRFLSRPEILGQQVKVNGQISTIIGVMPAGFHEPMEAELWAPLVAAGALRDNRRSHLLRVVARLRPDVNLAAAQAELGAISARIARDNLGTDPGLDVRVRGLRASAAAPMKLPLLALFGAAAAVLLVACSNLSNLYLVRVGLRTKEIAVRAALGASRRRLIGTILADSMLVAAAGGMASALLAAWTIALVRRHSPVSLSGFGAPAFDGTVALFAAALTVVAGLVCGLPAALARTRQADLGESRFRSPAKRRLRSSFLVLETALALVLLVAAGLLGKSFLSLVDVPLGLRPQNVLTLGMFLSESRFAEGDPRAGRYLKEVLERVRAVPGVQSAGMIDALPLRGGASTDFAIADRPAPKPGEEPAADIRNADPGYFATMGIALLAGRTFTDADNFTAPRVMIINQTMARRFWPDQSPLGKKVTMKDWGPDLTGEIVGVVADVKLGDPGAVTGPAIYWPCQQFNNPFATIVVQSAASRSYLVPAVKAAVWSIDREQAFARVGSMEDILNEALASRRFNTQLLAFFAGAALFLAALGVYAMLGQSVLERRKEIGVRMALGAGPRSVLALVLREGLLPVVAGVSLGVLGALALGRVIRSLLFGVQPHDLLTFSLVPVVFLAVAALACYFPARRATRLDPMDALRHE